LRARWLLHRLADGLPDDDTNRYRKRMAAKAAATLDQARFRDPELVIVPEASRLKGPALDQAQPRDPELKEKAPDP
jgi:hypothetical protein